MPEVLRSNAKLNLCLRITGRQADGYHTLSSIFQEIDLHDQLTFTPAANYSLSCDNPLIACDSSNLCTRAYLAMKHNANNPGNWHIYLEKRIPVGAGLGGGSSNAAIIIKFLNQSWGLNYPEHELQNIASRLGADVAFFIRGKIQLAEGIGNQLTPLTLPSAGVFLLICPPINISTRWAYQQFNLTNIKKSYKFRSLFESGRIHWELFENQFESVVFPTYPEIGEIKNQLLERGALYAGLSGSGSTMFGVFKDRQGAEKARQLFTNYLTFITLPVIS
jgi:4-diphosphocytidyl-2-C-methyl-D-erythritol kinase